MSNILFLVDNIPPHPSANGICADKIMRCLSNDNNVFCVGRQESSLLTPYKYYHLDAASKKKSKIAALFGFIKTLFFLPFYPLMLFKEGKKYEKLAEEIIEKQAIDAVVAVSFPGETFYAATRLKKKKGSSLKLILYPLDVFLEGNRSRCHLVQKLSQFFARKYFSKQIKISDKVIVLNNSRSVYEKKVGFFRNKFVFSGIPMIDNVCFVPKKSDGIFKILYAGNISSDMYNPIPVLDMVEKEAINNMLKVEFHLFGRGNKKIIRTLSNRYNAIKFINHGWVDESTLNQGLVSSDFCLNIAKSVTNTIPSKFFKYMCYFKPIVHYYYRDDDPCLSLLKKYQYSILIKHNDLGEISIIKSIMRMDVKYFDLKNEFNEYTPLFTANKIKEVLCDE